MSPWHFYLICLAVASAAIGFYGISRRRRAKYADSPDFAPADTTIRVALPIFNKYKNGGIVKLKVRYGFFGYPWVEKFESIK